MSCVYCPKSLTKKKITYELNVKRNAILWCGALCSTQAIGISQKLQIYRPREKKRKNLVVGQFALTIYHIILVFVKLILNLFFHFGFFSKRSKFVFFSYFLLYIHISNRFNFMSEQSFLSFSLYTISFINFIYCVVSGIENCVHKIKSHCCKTHCKLGSKSTKSTIVFTRRITFISDFLLIFFRLFFWTFIQKL